ncbi:alpha/beta fold hydrolase [Streptomyces sp. NBC_01261]|uniref:alpha/beta hydrolase n=1 Tax=Streptomyces sp. NBC_01261 TaxID=2903802 RepID=UPI002E30431F|nr:alpha/beta fold hydrolase [Streptomyces sp. NBC_01261]
MGLTGAGVARVALGAGGFTPSSALASPRGKTTTRRRRPAGPAPWRRGRQVAAVAGLLALLLVVSGCTSDGATSGDTRTPVETAEGTPNLTGAASDGGPARSQSIALTRDGIRLVGTLEVPALKAGQKVPLVIVMHGLTGSQNVPVVRATAQALREAGIASIRFDFDGHGASGGGMVDMTVPKEVADARSFYDYARALPFVSTIGLVGHSQGGVVAALLAGQLRDRVTALALLAPATTIPEGARSGNMGGTRYDPADPPESISMFGVQIGRDYLVTAQTLPINQVPSRYTAPVSIIHGSDDALIPPSRSEDYAARFRDGELHLLPGQDHEFSRNPDQPAALVARFMTAHLR